MSARPAEELLPLHVAFLECRPVTRPLLGLWFGGYYPGDQFPEGTSRWAEGAVLRPDDVWFAPFAADYDRLHAVHREVDDDFFYVGCAYWGIPWLEAILGCTVVASGASCRAEPCMGGLGRENWPACDVRSNPWLQALLRFTHELVASADGRFPVCVPLLRGPGDAATAMLGGMAFVTGCMDDPDAMARLLAHCAGIRADVLHLLSQAIPSWHGTYAAGGYPSKVWAGGSVVYGQEDAAAMLNPGLFRRLLLPLHAGIAGSADCSFVHLHSGCLYPIDAFLEGGQYTVIEVNVDHAGVGPPLERLVPTFRRIQAAGRPLLLWGHFTSDDWDVVHQELSPRGLSLQPIILEDADVTVALRYR